VELLLTTIPGVEDIAAGEARSRVEVAGARVLRAEIRPWGVQGHVSCQFCGSSESVLPAVMRMRSVHHVYRLVHRFALPASAWADALQKELSGLALPEMEAAETFRVTSQRRGKHSFTSMDVARTAGAVLDARFACRVDLRNHDLDVHVDVHGDACVVSVPLTRESLNRRHERVYSPRIGIQPVLAYCMLELAGLEDEKASVLDPFCGGGTILLEAAEVRPGIALYGSDADKESVDGATANAVATGVSDRIQFRHARAQDLPRTYTGVAFDAIVTNPPFGVGLGRELNYYCLYRDFLSAAAEVLEPNGRVVMLVWKRNVFRHVVEHISGCRIQEERHVIVGDLHPSIFVLRPRG